MHVCIRVSKITGAQLRSWDSWGNCIRQQGLKLSSAKAQIYIFQPGLQMYSLVQNFGGKKFALFKMLMFAHMSNM